MGYPMTYPRVVMRNGLHGSYAATDARMNPSHAAGDLRRLEADQMDDLHIGLYAKAAGVSKPKARAVLEAFFTDFGRAGPQPWLAAPCWPERSGT